MRIDWETSTSNNTCTFEREDFDRVFKGTHVGDLKRFTIERVLTFHTGKDFVSFYPSGLFQIGRDRSGLRTRTLNDWWSSVMMMIVGLEDTGST